MNIITRCLFVAAALLALQARAADCPAPNIDLAISGALDGLREQSDKADRDIEIAWLLRALASEHPRLEEVVTQWRGKPLPREND